MFMGFGPVAVLVTDILTTIISGIDMAERFIEGEGRGVERRQVVINNTASALEASMQDPRAQQSGQVQLLEALAHSLAAPDFRELLGKLVDATVDVANYLRTSHNVQTARPKLVQ